MQLDRYTLFVPVLFYLTHQYFGSESLAVIIPCEFFSQFLEDINKSSFERGTFHAPCEARKSIRPTPMQRELSKG